MSPITKSPVSQNGDPLGKQYPPMAMYMKERSHHSRRKVAPFGTPGRGLLILTNGGYFEFCSLMDPNI